MKNAIYATASLAAAATIALSTFGAAHADDNRRASTAAPVGMMKIQANSGGTATPFDNTAHAWTSACYAEFGPNAKYPDPALLQKCLDY
ncbi:hypothetical protein [Hoeflea prorocentri]|uniref:Uncharacterized protein n=1 Tax=Hoeflea prorocentri TaxID=1922333 RepID=A0A9X3UJN6_9HYPH|nr:hypothetical protein [Hoeflea prorocentri]MCY6380359.1 hypothetical protein [Hoeflea prorocentri]MDA5398159.1 hypothetical protein [Hoeflea prorocentri]